MSAFGAMFPGNRIQDEAGEAGDGQEFLSFGPIDLESGTVTLQTGSAPPPPDEDHDRHGGRPDAATGA